MAIPTATPAYDVLTIYRTEEGREALVVFVGAAEGSLVPWRNPVDGTVRIGYLTADPAEQDARTEHAWYGGTLTPVGVLDGFTDEEDS